MHKMFIENKRILEKTKELFAKKGKELSSDELSNLLGGVMNVIGLSPLI